ncbi:MAG: VCBS repeat-containing protein, partial [Planctomycetes bacterium]|nr:VCBS repeat-containing protein [Planctomycetota bacterium]
MDFDGDGTLDIISGSYDPGDIYLFRGLGKGRYAGVEQILDEAGTPLVHHPEELKAYERRKNDPTADEEDAITMRMASFGSWPGMVDWDNDGDFDMLIGSYSGGVYLRLNTGSRTSPRFSSASAVVEAGGQALWVWGHADPVPADWDA